MNRFSVAPLLLALVISACDSKSEAPKAEATKPAVAAAPVAAPAVAVAVAPAAIPANIEFVAGEANTIEFLMEAPMEKIRGVVPSGVAGKLTLDLADLTRTTGTVVADLSKLELHQQKADKTERQYGEEKKNDMQNSHARAWLEIDGDAPEAVRKQNEQVQFVIKSVERASATDLSKMTGAERKVTFTATGDFTLHGKTVTKSAELEATFTFTGDQLSAVKVATVKPVQVALEEHDVRPRDAFGKLAQKTLEAMAPKVNKEALVSLALSATVAPAAAKDAAVAQADAAPEGAKMAVDAAAAKAAADKAANTEAPKKPAH
jgi:hypothetical protein